MQQRLSWPSYEGGGDSSFLEKLGRTVPVETVTNGGWFACETLLGDWIERQHDYGSTAASESTSPTSLSDASESRYLFSSVIKSKSAKILAIKKSVWFEDDGRFKTNLERKSSDMLWARLTQRCEAALSAKELHRTVAGGLSSTATPPTSASASSSSAYSSPTPVRDVTSCDASTAVTILIPSVVLAMGLKRWHQRAAAERSHAKGKWQKAKRTTVFEIHKMKNDRRSSLEKSKILAGNLGFLKICTDPTKEEGAKQVTGATASGGRKQKKASPKPHRNARRVSPSRISKFPVKASVKRWKAPSTAHEAKTLALQIASKFLRSYRTDATLGWLSRIPDGIYPLCKPHGGAGGSGSRVGAMPSKRVMAEAVAAREYLELGSHGVEAKRAMELAEATREEERRRRRLSKVSLNGLKKAALGERLRQRRQSGGEIRGLSLMNSQLGSVLRRKSISPKSPSPTARNGSASWTGLK